MPYRTLDDRIDGLVITFIDISVAKTLEIKLAAANNEERGKRADDILVANKEVVFQDEEMKKLEAKLKKAAEILKKHNLIKEWHED
jgi:hypothetical protein